LPAYVPDPDPTYEIIPDTELTSHRIRPDPELQHRILAESSLPAYLAFFVFALHEPTRKHGIEVGRSGGQHIPKCT
jgi:hypothetical protein